MNGNNKDNNISSIALDHFSSVALEGIEYVNHNQWISLLVITLHKSTHIFDSLSSDVITFSSCVENTCFPTVSRNDITWKIGARLTVLSVK